MQPAEDEPPSEARAAQSGGDSVMELIDYLADAGAGGRQLVELCEAARQEHELLVEDRELLVAFRAVVAGALTGTRRGNGRVVRAEQDLAHSVG